MKKLILSLLLFTISASSIYAQDEITLFVKDNGKIVLTKDDADFIIVIQQTADKNNHYAVSEYFLDGTKKSEGFSMRKDYIIYRRKYVSYYKNGHIKSTNTDKDGLRDTVRDFYPNGKLYKELIYKKGQDIKKKYSYLKTVADSTGKEMVVKGNGKAVFYSKNFKEITDSGNVRNGLQDSVWTGIYDKDIKYREVFEHGHLTSGTSTDNKDVTVAYKQRLIQPAYKGGINELYAYISRKTKYPPKAVQQGTQGTVHLKFAVEKDGRITEVKVMNSVDPDLSEEAIRVLLSVSSMEPGLYRGRPSKMYFNLPVSFNLNR